MGRYAKESAGDFQHAPPGTHLARCIRIIDIGTQHGEYKGQATVRNQIVVQWELPNELMEPNDAGEALPFIVSRFYTNDLYEKANLYKDLVAWRGRAFSPEEKAAFDLMNILGKPCIVTVEHTDAGKAKVTGVAQMMKGMTCPPAVNETKAFWIDEWSDGAFKDLSEGFQKLIQASDEYKAAFTTQPAAKSTTTKPPADFEDDIPF